MSINETQKALLQAIASRLQVGRVSIWIYNEERTAITSDLIYSLKDHKFLPGLSLNQSDFPIYFKALDDNGVIDASDAINDIRTKEFASGYLKPLGITSMLDVPLKDGEKTIGVVCHEHIGEKRMWTNEEKLFALSLANQISIAISMEEKHKIEKALFESEQRFALAINALPVIFWTNDTNFIVTACSGHGLEKAKIDVNEIIGRSLFDLLGIDEDDMSYQYHLKALKGESLNFDYEFHGFSFQIFLEPLRDNSQKIIGSIGMAISTDESKHAEEAIRLKEKQLASVFDTVGDSIFVIDVESNGRFRFVAVNNAFQTTTGIDKSLIIGQLVNDIVPEPSLSLVLGHYNTAINEKRSVSWEETSEYPTGKLTGIVTIAPVFDDFGSGIKLIGSVKNITERKKIETELKENEARFRKLVETSDIIPWEIDAKTFICTYVGPQAEKILGYEIEEWYAPDFWTNHIYPEDQSRASKYFVDEFKNDHNYDFEYRMIAKDGSIVWFRDLVTVEHGPNDEPLKLRGYLIDITLRKLAEEQIQKMNIELEERVKERTAQLSANNIELQKAKIMAEESKAAKELFLASMSHEIRTPLNAIIGFQQLLKSTPLSEEQKEYVESIDFAGKNLLVIINDILDLSKIEAGKFQFDEVQFSVSDIVKAVIELVNHRAKEKNIKLYIYVDTSIPSALYGDSARLSQVLLNLIGNAIKFTEKGEVKISANYVSETEKDVLCEFVVEDTGIGIAPERLPYIFERFTQESVEINRAFGGTGLGLTISKYLVELQGGTINVTSEKGKGSVFTFQLKFKKQPVNASVFQNQLTDTNQDQFIERKLSILLAEDVLLNQRLVVKIMEKWGYDLDIAENGKVAVEKVKENDYDLVLMDIQMPVMDGYDAAQLIRSMPDIKKQTIPIIALTAHASNAEAEKCINIGMNSYMAKPFNQQHLFKVINQLVVK